jgi:HEAT repeat protein
MSDDFTAKLRAISDQLAPDFRAQGQRDVEMLIQAGADSHERLQAIAQDRNLSAETRTSACWAMAQLGDKRAVLILIGALKDPEAGVRQEAARSLGVLGSKRAVRPLIGALRRDAAVEVRAAAAYALGLLGDKRALNFLVSALCNQDEDPKVRGLAAEALADLRDRKAVPALIAALGDAVVDVRFWAAFALGELGDRRALPALRRLAATDEAALTGWRTVKEEASMAIQRIQERK